MFAMETIKYTYKEGVAMPLLYLNSVEMCFPYCQLIDVKMVISEFEVSALDQTEE